MRIALLADVHANLPALEAVLAHARQQRVDEFWDLGDMTGYGPQPGDVIACLRSVCRRHIQGNHDAKCLTEEHAGRLRKRGGDPDKAFSFAWTSRALSEDDKAFIAGLPLTDSAVCGNRLVLLVHGSPVGPADSLTPRTPASKFRSFLPSLNAAGVTVVVCGHTHEFFDRAFGEVRFINPGGIGRSFDGDPRAAYAILDIAVDHIAVEPYRVAYDVQELAVRLKDREFPQRLIRTFSEARNIEEIDGMAQTAVAALVTAAVAFGRTAWPQDTHSRRVTALAERLFDQTSAYFGLGWRERAWLSVAAVLHDIGWVYGQEGHHKASRDLIMKDTTLPLTPRERRMVAVIARYHRRSHPDAAHRYFRDMDPYEQETAAVLAGLLRIADALDRSHQGAVRDAQVTMAADHWTITVKPRGQCDVSAERDAAKDKAVLLQEILGCRIEFV